LGLYDPLTNAKAAKKIFDASGRWSDAWLNTSKKLGLVGVQSGQSAQGVQAPEDPVQENGETDYVARLARLAESGELQKRLATFDPKSLTSSQLSEYFGSSGFSSEKKQYTHNYGGVTININVPNGDAGEIAEAIKRVLQDTNMIEQAASR